MSYQGKAALAAILLTVGLVATAQPVKTVDAPYVPKGAAPAKSAPDLPFAPAAALPVDANPTMYLLPTKSVATQLHEMAALVGWSLVWEASDFTPVNKVLISSDFIKAVGIVIDSANLDRANLKATFYRGNNIVRVTETQK
ncbi:MAG: TcpQ domain-containing protein [Polaromonas sp.]|nr:TcpQ domain-containing protein [Polaromonas sp.]MDP3311287.1 TcpQ domain-containing protein [Polaromonas sp.]